MNNTIIKTYNSYHLGDNLFNIIFLNNISKYLEKNNIKIHYYLHSYYKDQVKEFIQTSNIILKDYDVNNESKMGLHLWIDAPIYTTKYRFTELGIGKNIPYNSFFIIFFNNILKIWKFPILISSIVYDDNDLITRYNNINDRCNNKYKNIDLLIINSIPLSGQFKYNNEEWINFTEYFKDYNVVTTNGIKNIKCTLDDNLTVKDIAAISTQCKVVVFVNSGVAPGLFNIYTLTNVKSFYCLDNRTYYSFPNFPKFKNYKSLNEISLTEVESFLV